MPGARGVFQMSRMAGSAVRSAPAAHEADTLSSLTWRGSIAVMSPRLTCELPC